MSIKSVRLLLFGALCLAVSGIHADCAHELLIGDRVYQVELAATFEQRRRGLMQRESLGSQQGMLFLYNEPGDHRIWMKNMLIPLWVYWIDANHRVIHRQRLEPCEGSPCAVYSAPQHSLYVLELGDYEHALAVGDRVRGLPGD